MTFIQWLFHVHDWTPWKEYGRGVIAIVQEKQCKTCGLIKTRIA